MAARRPGRGERGPHRREPVLELDCGAPLRDEVVPAVELLAPGLDLDLHVLLQQRLRKRRVVVAPAVREDVSLQHVVESLRQWHVRLVRRLLGGALEVRGVLREQAVPRIGADRRGRRLCSGTGGELSRVRTRRCMWVCAAEAATWDRTQRAFECCAAHRFGRSS
eukprot:2917818-Prymnesium_polylepis.1